MKHSQKSFWVQWSRLEASQLRYPKIVHLGPSTKVFHRFTCQRLVKCSESLPSIILGRMDYNGCFTTSVRRNIAFRLKHKFCNFHMLKVGNMNRNTPKHHFGSNRVEWMLHNFGFRKLCTEARNTSFASYSMRKVCEIHRNTPKHHFGFNGVEWMLHHFGTLK
jgi:hypothetical protein